MQRPMASRVGIQSPFEWVKVSMQRLSSLVHPERRGTKSTAGGDPDSVNRRRRGATSAKLTAMAFKTSTSSSVSKHRSRLTSVVLAEVNKARRRSDDGTDPSRLPRFSSRWVGVIASGGKGPRGSAKVSG